MLHGDRVLVIDREYISNTLSTTEVLDLTSGTSSPGPEMNTTRNGTSDILLPEDGEGLVVGGEGNDGAGITSTEVLGVARNSTSAGPELCIPRSSCTAVKLSGDHILVICEYNDHTQVSTSKKLGMRAKEEQQQENAFLHNNEYDLIDSFKFL